MKREELVEKVRELAKTHLSKDIRKELGITRGVLSHIIGSHGIVIEVKETNVMEPLFQKHKDVVPIMFEQGLSCAEIAEKLGTTYHQMYLIHKRLGIGTDNSSVRIKRYFKNRFEERRISKEDLYDLYYVQKKSMKEIYTPLSMGYKSMKKLFKEYGFELRTKSEETKLVHDRPEVKAKMRENAQSGIIGVLGQANRKYKDTSIERAFEAFCLEQDFLYKKQYRINGWGHPYDFFLPEFNLIVECDGEYFHNKPEQIMRDEIYNNHALEHGYDIIRFPGKKLKNGEFKDELILYVGGRVGEVEEGV